MFIDNKFLRFLAKFFLYEYVCELHLIQATFAHGKHKIKYISSNLSTHNIFTHKHAGYLKFITVLEDKDLKHQHENNIIENWA